jgi:hypothetical protein
LGWCHCRNSYLNAGLTRERVVGSITITELVSIESYGGNPDIVATREEIQRVALEIKLCAETLNGWNPLESLWSDPLHQIQF